MSPTQLKRNGHLGHLRVRAALGQGWFFPDIPAPRHRSPLRAAEPARSVHTEALKELRERPETRLWRGGSQGSPGRGSWQQRQGSPVSRLGCPLASSSCSAALCANSSPERDCVMGTRGFWKPHWMGDGQGSWPDSSPRAAPVQEGGVPLQSKLGVFSKRRGSG